MAPANRKMLNSEEIYEDLCLKIEKLVYMPGASISENDLCKTYNVTRHVIRNAFSDLKQRRLIEVYPQRGTYVSLIDMDYIEDILYLRESVEQEALARIMQLKDTKELTKELQDCVKAQKDLEGSENYSDEFRLLDSKFHEILLQSVGKKNVMELIEKPYIHVRRWRNFEIRTKRRIQEIIVEHEQIIEAIECKNPMVGREYMHKHLDTVSRYSESLKNAEAQYFL